MMSYRRAAAALAAIALTQTQLAHAATTTAPCMSEDEVTALIGYALPSVIDGTIKSCKPHLSSNGYFATRGGEFLGRYAARKNDNWPLAKTAFLKLGGSKDPKMAEMMKNLPDSAVQPFVEAMVRELVSGEIKPDQCTAIERGVRLLSPLPPENTAELVTFVLVLADKPKPGKASSFPICKPAA